MKSNLIKIAIGLLFLIVFNLLYFLLGGVEHTTTHWISYGFIHMAYLCLLLTPLFCGRNRKGETVLSAGLYLRALIYFIVELATGLAFVGFNPENYFWSAAIQGGLLTFFLIFQLMGVLANDTSKKSLAKQHEEKGQINLWTESLRGAMLKTKNPALHKGIERCYESLMCSSIENHPETSDIERELEESINMLCLLVDKGEESGSLKPHIERVQAAIQHRNRLIKRLKY